MKKKNDFLFSVIVPIFNVMDYLEETIESVVKQTIGFEENIQLILINDGSTDDCESICLKYKEKYPNNIIYVKKANGGVSSARNEGIKYVKGKFVNFLDSDDLWDDNAFNEVRKKIYKHPKIKLFSCKMVFFEQKTGNHPLNYKYDRSKIVNIHDNPNYIQLSVSSMFISNDLLQNNRFDVDIHYSEDTKFINDILFYEENYMVLSKPIYHYRWRKTFNSAIQRKIENEEWYIYTLKNVFKYFVDLSIKKYGIVLKYFQYLVFYELKWRIQEFNNNVSFDFKSDYIELIKHLLGYIDDDVICDNNKNLNHKNIYFLSLKYKKNLLKDLVPKSSKITLFDDYQYNLRNNILTINVINYKNGLLDITGTIDWIYSDKYKLFANINNQRKEVVCNNEFTTTLDDSLFMKKTFRIKEKFDLNDEMCFEINFDNLFYKLKLGFTMFGRLNSIYKFHYNVKECNILYKKDNIILNKKRFVKSCCYELYNCFNFLSTGKWKNLFYRFSAKLYGIFCKKNIWIISDRTMVANDNGFALFKYLSTTSIEHTNIYFTISKKSKDYGKALKYGKVLPYNSLKYKILFLNSSKIISSQADNWVINPFGKSEKYYRDMFTFAFVFLQHGITKDDQTSWLNYKNKNIKLLITAAKPEYNSFLDYNYGYDESIIRLTGFPRFDNLVNCKEKYIAIMPTWRQNISGLNNPSVGIRSYSKNFKNSQYYKFYSDLINDSRLIKVMKKNNIKGVFVLHPSHVRNSIDFKSNDVFSVVSEYADYQEIFKKAALLITDYSSVAFDFSYLKKPIIYSQFDKKEFFQSHLYSKGYFDYEKHGFGEVVYNYNDTVGKIINSIENDFENSSKYLDRVSKFYRYFDQENAKRVTEEIIKLDK